MGRPYTGWDGDAKGRRAGTEKFVQLLCAQFKNGIWNNGTWNVRPANNGTGKPSVHGTGRAADLSWRKNGDKGFGNYEQALAVLEFCVAHAETLLIEELHDYYLKPYGRGWRCDRSAWKVYDKPTLGTPGGDWWHIEISPLHADDPGFYDAAFKAINSGAAVPAAPAPAVEAKPALTLAYPGKPVKKGSKGDSVKLVQAMLKVPETGSFDAATDAAIKSWQTKNGLLADGVIGPKSWAVLFA